MKKSFILLCLFISCLRFSPAQEKEKNITFIVKTLIQPVDTLVFITGNHTKLGNWNPSIIKMEKQKDNLWKLNLTFPKGEKLEFKFTKGSWATEGVNSKGTVGANYRLTVQNDTTIEITIENWLNNFPTKTVGQITGTVQYIRNLEGAGIKPRDIIIWLPPGYSDEQNKRYPVLYMHDGQNIIDPLTSAFGIDWQVDETADSLIAKGKMKEIIIVGIYNTAARTAEYSNNDTGFAYMKFIIEKLKPLIDSKFRTLPDRKNTATMGSSMGGLISLMLAWEHSEVFSMAGCLSPAFKIDRFNYMPNIEKYKGDKKDIRLYIDDGGAGLDKHLLPGIKETIELLNKKVISAEINALRTEIKRYNQQK